MKRTPPTTRYSQLRYERTNPYSKGKVPRIWLQEELTYRSFFRDLLNDGWNLLRWFKKIYRKELVIGSILLLALLPEPQHVKALVPIGPLYIQSVAHLEAVQALDIPIPGAASIIAPEPIPEPVAAPVSAVVSPSGSHTDWMVAAGISSSDYGYVDYIIDHESSWSYLVVNPIGATGLCQSLPGSKMASVGSDYLSNPVTQLIWCNSYAAKYGGWYGSYQYWLQNHYW